MALAEKQIVGNVDNLLCNICKAVKPYARFKSDSRRQFIFRGGKHTTCKDCENINVRARRVIVSDEDPRITNGFRVCTACSAEKPLLEFTKAKTGPLGRSHHCRPCTRKRQREYRHGTGKNLPRTECPQTNTESHRKYKYNLSAQAFKALYCAQNGICGICKSHLEFRSKKTCVDHDHATGMIRGVLCANCNWALGHFRDSTKYLASAIDYLKMHGGG